MRLHQNARTCLDCRRVIIRQIRAELERLRAEPALARSAVEELLRYDSPVQMTARLPGEDLEIRGQQIQAGQEVNLILAAANRDPAQFEDPDRLDLGRSENRHLAFGQGAHFCLGAPLARLEGQVAFERLVKRFPRLDLTGEKLRWKPGVVLRGLKALPLAF